MRRKSKPDQYLARLPATVEVDEMNDACSIVRDESGMHRCSCTLRKLHIHGPDGLF